MPIGSFGNVSNVVNLVAAAAPTKLRAHPFLKGCPALASSAGAATFYGVDHPGDGSTAKYATWKQSVAGNKAFVLPSTNTAPAQTVGGAIAAVDQLRSVVMVDGTTLLHSRDDQVAVASGFVWGAGGGTAVSDATLITDGANAIGAIVVNIKSTGVNTNTVIVGDRLTFAGDATVYYVTETSQAMNGVTAVAVDITPPLVAAPAAGAVVTVAASLDRTLILNAAPAVGSAIEALVMLAADITTYTGGAMVANRNYEIAGSDFVCAGVADVQVMRLAR